MRLTKEKIPLLLVGAVAMAAGVVVADTPLNVTGQETPLTTPSSSDQADTEALADDVQRRLRAARSIHGRAAKREALEQLVPAAEQLASRQPGPRTWEPLVVVQLGVGHYQRVQQICETWAAQVPEDWLSHFYLGQALSADRAYEPALAALERASALTTAERDQSLIYRSRGFLLEKLRRYPEALALYERMGDEAAVTRVKCNLRTLDLMGGSEADPLAVEDEGYVCPDFDLEQNGKRLEEELKALENPSQP